MTKLAASTTSSNQALVLGATGNIGSAVMQQLLDSGWKVRAMTRNLDKVLPTPAIEWIKGDALKTEDIMEAAQGCSVIIHAVNPAGYKNWDTLVLPMLENTLMAAHQNNACVVVPGNVYNYGPDTYHDISESSPQHPRTRKGKIRVQMEQRLQEFSLTGGQVILVRCGDYFGPTGQSSWFAQAIVKANTPIKRILNPSSFNVGHQWAYLPDVAKVMMQLINRRHKLEAFNCFHMDGYWDSDGKQLAQIVSDVATKHRQSKQPKIYSFPWWVIDLMAPFHRTSKELLEMKYLWQNPVKMNNTKLLDELGEEPQTPIREAVQSTLEAMNCLPYNQAD